MYAKLCNIEILPSYIKDVSIGDLLTVQALVTNPLDWHHFYDKISTIKKGEKTSFMVVTVEGERLEGQGDIVEVEKWNNHGHYGFKIKVDIKRQKSLTDRRTRIPKKERSPFESPKSVLGARTVPVQVSPVTAALTVDSDEIVGFNELLKDSLSMDMSH